MEAKDKYLRGEKCKLQKKVFSLQYYTDVFKDVTLL